MFADILKCNVLLISDLTYLIQNIWKLYFAAHNGTESFNLSAGKGHPMMCLGMHRGEVKVRLQPLH